MEIIIHGGEKTTEELQEAFTLTGNLEVMCLLTDARGQAGEIKGYTYCYTRTEGETKTVVLAKQQDITAARIAVAESNSIVNGWPVFRAADRKHLCIML